MPHTDQRDVGLLVVLFIAGSVLIGFATSMFVPDTPGGGAIVFAATWTAMYPVTRRLWFATVPAWRWFAAVASGTFAFWALDTWRSRLSEATNHEIALVTVVCVLANAFYALRTARRSA